MTTPTLLEISKHMLYLHQQQELLTMEQWVSKWDAAFTNLRAALQEAEKPQPISEPVTFTHLALTAFKTDHPADKEPFESQQAFTRGWNMALKAVEELGPLYAGPQPRGQ